MVDWPSELPNLHMPLSEQRQSGSIRSEMEIGPAKVRRRFTAVPRRLQAQLVLNGVERRVLDGFHDDYLREGALSFNHEDPRGPTGTFVAFRFMAPPEWSLLRTDPNADERLWQANLTLEILP